MNTVSREQLAEVIGEKTMHIKNADGLAKAIATYLSEEHKSIDLASLTRDVMQYRLEHGIVEATVVSAHELTPVVMKDIEELLKDHFPDAKSIILDNSVDVKMVGGVRIDLPKESLDLTVRSKLNLFKRLISEESI